MILSTAGAIAQGFWYDIPNHFPFVQLGAFVVMPNHIHGILILDKSNSPNAVETLHCNVSTAPPIDKNEFYANISPAAGSVSTIVRSYKSVCTKHIHKALPALDFGWQERFWDNIIKDEAGFHRIAAYIVHNPQNWQEDKFYLTNTIK
jgi:REP element-mobilizing transposase RayT